MTESVNKLKQGSPKTFSNGIERLPKGSLFGNENVANGDIRIDNLESIDMEDVNTTFTNGNIDGQESAIDKNDLSFDSLSCVSSEDVDSLPPTGELLRKLSSHDSEFAHDSDTENGFDCKPKARIANGKRSYACSVLEWQDEEHNGDMVHRLNVFRKSRQFCDLIIQVGGRELYCHRVIVGAASRAIFNELCRGEQESGAVARIPLNSAMHNWVPEAVEILIDYMYTAKLSIPSNLVTSVYKACRQLGIERVTPVCTKHIVSNLDIEEAVQIRRLASRVGDTDLKDLVDGFIDDNFEAVVNCSEFLNLPRIKMEISPSLNSGDLNLLSLNMRDGALCTTALSWVYDVIQRKGGHFLEELTEQVQRVSADELHLINSAQCTNKNIRKFSTDLERCRLGDGNARPVTFASTRLSRSSSMDSLTSSDTEEIENHVESVIDGEWKIIASNQTGDRVTALCCSGDVMCTLTIHLPSLANGDLPNGHDGSQNPANGSGWSSASTSCSSSSVGSVSHLCQLNRARCAAGIAALNGKLFATGGFNQSECLDSVECFDPTANRWSVVCHMNERRGRFSVGVVNGLIYAVGGSSGSQNHMTVERYDPVKDTWTYVGQLLFHCSESGVAVLNDLLYCVGGVQQSSGVAGLKHCQVYNPDRDSWELRSQMHTGRSSLGAATLGGHLYVSGGSDGWSCLASSERYDPKTDHWAQMASLNVPRRGLGMTSHNGALYCAGGFDGHTFLSSVERYAPDDGDVWCHVIATLTLPRSNVGLASMNGSLFVVGGFSGRHFLASVELLDESNNEWTNQEQQSSAGVTSNSESEQSNE